MEVPQGSGKAPEEKNSTVLKPGQIIHAKIERSGLSASPPPPIFFLAILGQLLISQPNLFLKYKNVRGKP